MIQKSRVWLVPRPGSPVWTGRRRSQFCTSAPQCRPVIGYHSTAIALFTQETAAPVTNNSAHILWVRWTAQFQMCRSSRWPGQGNDQPSAAEERGELEASRWPEAAIIVTPWKSHSVSVSSAVPVTKQLKAAMWERRPRSPSLPVSPATSIPLPAIYGARQTNWWIYLVGSHRIRARQIWCSPPDQQPHLLQDLYTSARHRLSQRTGSTTNYQNMI